MKQDEVTHHFVDENMTNYADYACTTDGVNMNTHNQACISKLEFGEPSPEYNGLYYIEMNFHAFNLSKMNEIVEVETEVEDSFWTIKNAAVTAGVSGFSLAAIAFILWGKRPNNLF